MTVAQKIEIIYNNKQKDKMNDIYEKFLKEIPDRIVPFECNCSELDAKHRILLKDKFIEDGFSAEIHYNGDGKVMLKLAFKLLNYL